MSDFINNTLKIHCDNVHLLQSVKNVMFKTVDPNTNQQCPPTVEKYLEVQKKYHEYLPDKENEDEDVPEFIKNYQYRILEFDMNLLLPYPNHIDDKDDVNINGTNLIGFDSYSWHNAIWGTKWNVVDCDIIKYTDTDIELSYRTANGANDYWTMALIRYAFNIDVMDESDFSLEHLYNYYFWDMGGKIFTRIDGKTKKRGYTAVHYDDYLEFLQDNFPEAYLKELEERKTWKGNEQNFEGENFEQASDLEENNI